MIASERQAQWQQAGRILCIRADHMGDVLMATPAMRAIQYAHPSRQLTLLASASGAAIAPFIPELDDVIEYAAPWMKDQATPDAQTDLEAIAALRARCFDAAIIFTSYSQSPLPAALHCHLAGIPLRLAHCHENPYRLLTDWMADPEPGHTIRHEVRRQLDLVRAIGCSTANERLSLQLRTRDITGARRHLNKLGVDLSRKWLLMHPGASAPSRRYPTRHWAQVIRQLTAMDYQVVLSGSASEQQAIEEIKQTASAPAVTVAGTIDLGTSCAMTSLSPLLISNNSGPVHIAAAVGTPVVDLYALTNPQHTPWQVPNRVLYHDVPCRFCYRSQCPLLHQHCLSLLDPQRVVDAALDLMAVNAAL